MSYQRLLSSMHCKIDERGKLLMIRFRISYGSLEMDMINGKEDEVGTTEENYVIFFTRLYSITCTMNHASLLAQKIKRTLYYERKVDKDNGNSL